jgi:putative membrane protein
VAYGRTSARHSANATRALLSAMFLVSALEAVDARGARRGVALAAWPAAAGFAAEVVGVASGRPFGHYAYTDKLGPRVAGVPILAAAAWSMMARPAWVAAGWTTTRATARVALAAAGLTAWDVYLDPRMVAEGYWVWPKGGRYEGVPASNFAGWYGVGIVVFAGLAALDRGPVGAVDDGALFLYAWTWVGEAVANGLLWQRRRPALAGALAMGALAVPALRGRLSR